MNQQAFYLSGLSRSAWAAGGSATAARLAARGAGILDTFQRETEALTLAGGLWLSELGHWHFSVAASCSTLVLCLYGIFKLHQKKAELNNDNFNAFVSGAYSAGGKRVCPWCDPYQRSSGLSLWNQAMTFARQSVCHFRSASTTIFSKRHIFRMEAIRESWEAQGAYTGAGACLDPRHAFQSSWQFLDFGRKPS